MLRSLRKRFADVGLILNGAKCKVQTTAFHHGAALKIDRDFHIPIISAWDGFKILGTQFTLFGRTAVELDARIQMAWGRFHKIWPLLRQTSSSLRKSLLIFRSDVVQSLLWCCESWTLTVAECKRLQAVERSMLRKFLGPRRQSGEDYLDWIVHATRAVEAIMADMDMLPAVHLCLQRKWIWAGCIARYPAQRWIRRVTSWRDSRWWREHEHNHLTPSRFGRTHWHRWEDSLRKFADERGWSSWQSMASEMDAADWDNMASTFSDFCF